MNYAIKTESLTKKYKDLTAVDSLDLTVKEGELFALLGVNGAGKTTTIKMLTCLLVPDSGEAFLNGKSILTASQEVKRNIGVSPQETAIAPMLTVYENLEFMCGVYGFDKIRAKEKIKELSEKFNLASVMKRKAGKLSGGFQRRLSIALALIGEPEIIFLDEPTLGLDVIARRDLWNTVCALKGERTVIFTTHYMEEAEALADRVGIMKDGRLLAVGRPEEIKEMTGKERFEEAFISLVKGDTKL